MVMRMKGTKGVKNPQFSLWMMTTYHVVTYMAGKLEPWQTMRLYWTPPLFTRKHEEAQAKRSDRLRINTGEYDPTLGVSYAEIGGVAGPVVLGILYDVTAGFGAGLGLFAGVGCALFLSVTLLSHRVKQSP